MNKKLLAGIGLLAAYVLYSEGQNLKNTINGLSVSFLPGDWPRMEGGRLIFPISVQVKNPGDRSLPLDSLRVNLFRETKGSAYLVASTPAAGVTLPTFAARQITKFTVNLEVGILDAITELATTVKSRGFNKFRIESSVGAAGTSLTLPAYRYTI